MSHIDPTEEQIVALTTAAAATEAATPIIMVNLNRYRERAAYDDPGPDDISGREAYRRYGEVALRAMAEVGGRVVCGAPTEQVFVGCEHDTYYEVLTVWYPNRAAFLAMISLPWYQDALVHRRAALEHASIIACTGSD